MVDGSLPTAASAKLDPVGRTVSDAGHTVAAGVGPAQLAETRDLLFVTDTVQGAVLVFRRRPELVLQRRAYLPGGPFALAVDPAAHRLWVTLTATNEVVGLTLDGAVKERERFPAVRAPRAVAVRGGRVVVAGADHRLQLLPRSR